MPYPYRFTRSDPPALLAQYNGSGEVRYVVSSTYGFFDKYIYNMGVPRRKPAEPNLFMMGTMSQFKMVERKFGSPGRLVYPNGAFYEYDPILFLGAEQFLPPDYWGAKKSILDKGKQQIINLAVFLAEYKQTAAMANLLLRAIGKLVQYFTKPSKLWKLIKHKLKGKKSKYMTGMDSLSSDQANLWLFYTYGIVPLANDLEAAFELLKKRAFAGSLIHRASGRAPKKIEEFVVEGYQHPYAAGPTRRRVRREVATKATAQFTIPSTALTNVLVQTGFTNPLSVLWEIVPLSFVVDWGLKVGDSIASLDNCLSLGPTCLVEYGYKQTLNVEASYYGGSATRREIQKVRQPPVPVSTTLELAYRPSFNARRLMTTVSLLRQRSTGIGPAKYLKHP